MVGLAGVGSFLCVPLHSRLLIEDASEYEIRLELDKKERTKEYKKSARHPLRVLVEMLQYRCDRLKLGKEGDGALQYCRV